MNEDGRIINWMNEGTEIAKGNGLSEDFMVWMLRSAFLIKARTFAKEEKEESGGRENGV